MEFPRCAWPALESGQIVSYQAVSWALRDAPQIMTDKGQHDISCRFVLVTLAEHADEHGLDARPSPLKIAYLTGLDVQTVKRALRRLEKHELIARDGLGPGGVVRWKLALHTVRDPNEWAFLLAEAEAERAADTRARADRRARKAEQLATAHAAQIEEAVAAALAAAGVSGTQDAGHATAPAAADTAPPEGVRHAECRTPAQDVPDPATQTPGVRHATPPEPSVSHPVSARESSIGGTLPPNPLRPHAPRTSGRGTESRNRTSEQHDVRPQAVNGDSRPREGEHAPGLHVVEGNPDAAPSGERGLWPSPVDDAVSASPAAAGTSDPQQRPYGPQWRDETGGRPDVDDVDQAHERAV